MDPKEMDVASMERLLNAADRLASAAAVIAESAAKIAEAVAILATPATGSKALSRPSLLEEPFLESRRSSGPVSVAGLNRRDYAGLKRRNVGKKKEKDAINGDDHLDNRTSAFLWWELNHNIDEHDRNGPLPLHVKDRLPAITSTINSHYFNDVGSNVTSTAMAAVATFTDLCNAIFRTIKSANKLP